MTGRYDIYLYRAGGDYRVRPAVTMFRAGAEVTVRSLVASDALLVLPAGVVAGGARGVADVVSLHAMAVTAFHLAAGLDGRYAFQVLVCERQEVVAAAGESGPSMIVDP